MVWAWAGSLLQTVARMTVSAQHIMSRKVPPRAEALLMRSPGIHSARGMNLTCKAGRGSLRASGGCISNRALLHTIRTLLCTNEARH